MTSRCYTVIYPLLYSKLTISFVCRGRSLNSSREEKLVWKNNNKETISELLNVSPTSHGQKTEKPTYSAHNCEKPKYIGFALDVLLKPSMLSSGFLPVGMNNLLTLNKRLFFLFQMQRWDLCLSLKKTKRHNYNSPRTSIFLTIQELFRLRTLTQHIYKSR